MLITDIITNIISPIARNTKAFTYFPLKLDDIVLISLYALCQGEVLAEEDGIEPS